MRSIQRVVLTALLCALAAASLPGAQSAPHTTPMSVPVPDPALEQLAYFLGNWQCKGRILPGVTPGRATAAQLTSQRDLGGFWVRFRHEETKSAASPTPFAVAGHWGYDGEEKRFIQEAVDNFGGFATQFSPGWEGAKLAFTGEYHTFSGKVLCRVSFTKNGNDELVYTYEFNPKNDWIEASEEVCTRQR